MEEVEDEPLFADRVAGLDIGKAGVEVTIRVPGKTAGSRFSGPLNGASSPRTRFPACPWLPRTAAAATAFSS